VALIRASEGLYRSTEVAKAYAVHRSTVTRIWAGCIHKDIDPAPEPPNIITKARPRDVADDIRMLLDRGMTHQEVAEALGISKGVVSVYKGLFV
jgi:DNA invertase Pin-like site-specific DNA recombinase